MIEPTSQQIYFDFENLFKKKYKRNKIEKLKTKKHKGINSMITRKSESKGSGFKLNQTFPF